jgi:cytochrome P450 family 110
MQQLPQGPKSFPLLQQVQWISDPLRYMETSAQRYGDIFTAKIGWNFKPLVFVSHPEAIQKIFANETKQFDAPGSVQQIFQPLLGEYSVVRTVDGFQHRRKRKLLMPPFHGERMGAYGQLVCDITERTMDRLTVGNVFSAQIILQEISLQVTLEGVFGLREGERRERFKQLMASWLDALSSPVSSTLLFIPFLQQDFGAWSPWGHLSRLKQQINDLLQVEIRERRQHFDPSGTDILTLLMSARDEAGEPMSDKELCDELLTLMVAGYETTATAMAWMLYWVYYRTDVREQLLKELADLGEAPDPIAISRLPYLGAVCQEILRIYPAAYATFPRVTKSPVPLMGYELPTGTEVIACIYLTHQREDLYPDPKQFKPERFLERKFSPYEYLPFGGGSRVCIGAAFALFEMKLVLATLLSRYQLTLVDRQPVQAQVLRLTLAPKGGVKMVLAGQYKPQERFSSLAART